MEISQLVYHTLGHHSEERRYCILQALHLTILFLSFTLLGGLSASFEDRQQNFNVHVGNLRLLVAFCFPDMFADDTLLPKLNSLLCSAAADSGGLL